jgi:hypothetical protein
MTSPVDRTPTPSASEPPAAARRPEPPAADVTTLLQAWAAGDPAALRALLPLVDAELRLHGERAMRRADAGHTPQATTVVHDAYLRLALAHQPRSIT